MLPLVLFLCRQFEREHDVHDAQCGDSADERKLKALGAAGVVKLGEQNLQVILGPLAEIIAGEMKALR